MLIKNYMSEGLVNGSRGVVIGYRRYDDKALQSVDESSYGVPIDRVKYDLRGDSSDELSDVYEVRGTGNVCPIVSFLNGKTKVVTGARFDSRIVGIGTCWRDAIPLKLAFSMTVHKSQGMTLDYVVADLDGAFAKAQVYVALSRAKDENGLEIRNYDAQKVKADSRALRFYKNPKADFPVWGKHEQEDSDKPLVLPRGEDNCLAGKTFVLTGVLTGLTRDGAKKLIEDYGGFVRGAISGKTNYLVMGEYNEEGGLSKDGAKHRDAMKIMQGPNKSDLKILDREGLFSLIQTSKPPQKPVSVRGFFKPR
jgi:hypothetical protein